MAAPLPLDGTHDPDAGDTATAAPTTDTGAAVDTDPNPVTTGILADEHREKLNKRPGLLVKRLFSF